MRRTQDRIGRLAVAALVVSVLAVVGPWLATATAPMLPSADVGGAHRPGIVISDFTATVTWNGHNVSSASSPSSAFSLARGQTAAVDFTYSGASAASVTNATLEVTYLGVVLVTSKTTTRVVGGPPVTGAGQINWSFGTLYDALEGVFQLSASLEFANGTTAWSESFYVIAKTPYFLESGAVIVFLALAIAELYWGISSVREARQARKPAAPPPPPAQAGAAPVAGAPSTGAAAPGGPGAPAGTGPESGVPPPGPGTEGGPGGSP